VGNGVISDSCLGMRRYGPVNENDHWSELYTTSMKEVMNVFHILCDGIDSNSNNKPTVICL